MCHSHQRDLVQFSKAQHAFRQLSRLGLLPGEEEWITQFQFRKPQDNTGVLIEAKGAENYLVTFVQLGQTGTPSRRVITTINELQALIKYLMVKENYEVS